MSRLTPERQPSATAGDRDRAAAIAVPFAAIVLAMLPAVLDQTILATALPTIAAELGRLSDISWVVTAYVVATATTTPLWGQARRPPRPQAPARALPGAVPGRPG